MIWKVSRQSGKFLDNLMHKILQNHLLCAFVANLKIDALYPESFCGKNLAIPKVFAFCDSAQVAMRLKIWEVLQGSQNAKLINAWKWKGQIVFEHSPQNQFIETNDCQRKNLNLKKNGEKEEIRSERICTRNILLTGRYWKYYLTDWSLSNVTL